MELSTSFVLLWCNMERSIYDVHMYNYLIITCDCFRLSFLYVTTAHNLFLLGLELDVEI